MRRRAPAAAADDHERPLRACEQRRASARGRARPGCADGRLVRALHRRTSTCSTSMSSGSASTTGPGRPDVAVWKARADVAPASASASIDLADPLRHRPEHLAVVDLLERLATELSPPDLADQQDHRRRVLERGVDAARRVRRARPARDEADPRAAGQLAVRVGHVRGADLVAADDEADRRVVERVEHREVALAGDAEDEIDAVQLELVDEDLAARARHPSSRAWSKKTVGRWSFGFSSSSGST